MLGTHTHSNYEREREVPIKAGKATDLSSVVFKAAKGVSDSHPTVDTSDELSCERRLRSPLNFSRYITTLLECMPLDVERPC